MLLAALFVLTGRSAYAFTSTLARRPSTSKTTYPYYRLCRENNDKGPDNQCPRTVAMLQNARGREVRGKASEIRGALRAAQCQFAGRNRIWRSLGVGCIFCRWEVFSATCRLSALALPCSLRNLPGLIAPGPGLTPRISAGKASDQRPRIGSLKSRPAKRLVRA